ncbi:hypothetical protein BT93_L1779 [Corymbia citriodora subsp. variegata]|uniref:B3 domain-containing protein n=1 Tax=Corymbia citriodora subsp. variegata TaxID=360336 RepID=A0A8T0CPB3_CORYI|nr:hypothetical protein BT93_L1779 [Corymbia citriodora subsp. variegata]
MELNLSPLHLLADIATWVSNGNLGLAPSTSEPDDEKKSIVATTTFGPTAVGWIVRKKRSPRARGPTFRAQKLNSDPDVQNNVQENWKGVAQNCKKRSRKLNSDPVVQNNVQEIWRGAQNCKKRSRVFDSTETHDSDRVFKKPKQTQKKNVVDLMGPRELPTIFMDKVIEMGGRDVRLVVQKKLSATDMNPSQSRLSIPKSQILQGFLSDQEIRTLDSKDGIRVFLIDPCLELHQGLQLKKWCYGSKTFSYVLTERWNAVAHPHKPNGLEKDAVVQLWSFRQDGNLRFCLTKV